MSPRAARRRAHVVAVAALVACAAAPAARAQTMVEGQEAAPPPVERARPRMSIAIGMGATFEDSGFQPARTEPVPAFFAMGEIGDDVIGFGMSVFASQAAGRFRTPDAPVDRLALDVLAVLRPLAVRFPRDSFGYGARVARSVAGEVGIGLEREGRGTMSGSRFGLHTGAYVELPLVPAGQRTELRLRLGVRRMFGLYQPQVGDTPIGDTTELYGALAIAF